MTNIYWERVVVGSKGDLYTVRFERVDEEVAGVLYDYTCTCKAFYYNPRKYCSHIKRVKDERCGWSQLVDGGFTVMIPEEPYFLCPRCSGEVDFYREAV